MKNAADSESTDYHGIIIWQSQRKKSIFRKLNCIGSKKFFLGLIMIQKIQVSPEELEPIIAELQQNLTDRFLWMRNFYFHLYREDELIVVFRDQIFHLTADVETWKDAIKYGKSLGIPEKQLDFKPCRFEDETF